MLELGGGLVLIVAWVRGTPGMDVLIALHTTPDEAEHGVPLGLWKRRGVIPAVGQPGTAGHHTIQMGVREIPTARRGRIRIDHLGEPGSVLEITWVIADVGDARRSSPAAVCPICD